MVNIVLLLLLSQAVVITTIGSAISQNSDFSSLSYAAFNQLSEVYRSGGTAPILVSKLNYALGLIEEARAKRAEGDTSDASALEEQARSIIDQLTPEIATAQQEAVNDSISRARVAYGDAVLVILVLTLGFYLTVGLYRWYENEKLYEMRIIDETVKD
jgi:hypothetical protein